MIFMYQGSVYTFFHQQSSTLTVISITVDPNHIVVSRKRSRAYGVDSQMCCFWLVFSRIVLGALEGGPHLQIPAALGTLCTRPLLRGIHQGYGSCLPGQPCLQEIASGEDR